ncbi:nonribosomal siderophore peptide synthase Sid2 [Lasiosphaeris hirsuta]|uniref:Nonribosomal siderophore peptide synthase Sid2 n=1 Tax=Lasiosphaeris hirsuta TaxID=260670 RepID=A0AA40BDD2_9PEZI|nr:nonribosomal siderophore peptide synthase Sid2 [Lasiosphaeris hirsuta]
MGSLQVEDAHWQSQSRRGHKEAAPLIGQANGDGFMSFEVDSLRSATPTGMREEILLLSWLIVLLRTQEDSEICFDFDYQGSDDVATIEPVNVDIAIDLQTSVSQNAAAISHHITSRPALKSQTATSHHSLVLSTGPLSQSSGEANDQPAIHLETRFEGDRLSIRPVWHSKSILPFTVTLHIETLVDTVKFCLAHPNASIAACLGPAPHDLDCIWEWNHELPPTIDRCMHDVISERAQTCPDKEAISSWDGGLTYGQIDTWSTSLAWSLKEAGVALDDFVPVCFEKSCWTIIAVLAVMKAGATLVMMDPSLPLARLQNMASQIRAETMVSSLSQRDLAQSILPDATHLTVGPSTFPSHPQEFAPLPTVPSSTLMYIIFTSGSTGTPKGVQISHLAYTSSAFPRAAAVGYTPSSRVLDFASYAFDVSIDSMLLTLANGGCLCIPSDEARLDDINGVMRSMRVNYAGITPSVARILDLDVIAGLTGLGLGGEAAAPRDVNFWGEMTRIIIGYGPCECTIGCTVNASAAKGRDYITIGPGNGAAMWVVDPDDHDTLMPVGAVGELLVEGPIVGQGYLGDPEKTAAAFIHDPKWLTAGHGRHAGRSGRLYKTGDLGRYDPDGSGEIVFVGRKDTQVKLRGQRVELGEIESQLKARLPADTNVIVEVIVPQGSGGQPALVAFVAPQSAKAAEIASAELPVERREALSKADTEIAKVLPRYMVPNAYIPVSHIPTLISGKTDRKRLRAFGATVDLRKLDQNAPSAANDRELGDMEQRLREAWGFILKLDAKGIRLDDNFFALGGESLAAMKLVSVCRERGLDLSVASTFSHPTLSAMAEVVTLCDESQAQVERAAFSMISQSFESARIEASQVCEMEPADVEDIYPCTPTQESLFTFSLKSVEAYIAQRVACIPSHITVGVWKKAWEEVVAASPILRTRLVQLQDDSGLRQVVLKESIRWNHSTDLARFLATDSSQRMELGQSLARYTIVYDAASSNRYMIWTVHHALYDGWSEPLILEKVLAALQPTPLPSPSTAHMADFVQHVLATDQSAMESFWRRELAGAVGPQFPRVPSRDFLPIPDTIIEHRISLPAAAGFPFTLATLIRGAWALLASRYTGSDDIVFGETLTGRDIPLRGVEGIVGPLIATVPIRDVQTAVSARTPWQHMGMQNIRRVSRDAQYACEAPMGLVIQPETVHVGSELGFEGGDPVREAIHFNPYPLMLACGITQGGLRVCASFDSRLMETRQMERMLRQLEAVCGQLTRDLDRRVDQIPCVAGDELERIWRWNEEPPLSLDEFSKRLRADAHIKTGEVYPRPVVPWVCDPRSPGLLAPIGCAGELWLEGAFFTGETVESPSWLVAGSSARPGRMGRVQPTGDIVRLREDGSLVFIGRKENVVPAQGHSVAIAELEVHFDKYLPSSARAAAVVFQAQTGQELVAFVEQLALEGEGVQVMATDRAVLETRICGRVSVGLAAALKRLDKFVRNSLPSHLAPSAYVVVDKMPAKMGHVDRGVLKQLASAVPQVVLEQLRGGFEEAWKRNLSQPKLSVAEDVLRSSWAKILGIAPEQIDIDDNFFRLGGDSVLAMKLVSALRLQGHGLTVADIFQHMRLGDAAKVLKVNHRPLEKVVKAYSPFSLLGHPQPELFVEEAVRPRLADPSWAVQDVYPVTDSQLLDIKATVHAPRTSIQYTMLYFNDGIDRERLLRACHQLVQAHDILRTVFIEYESTFFQVVLEELDAPISMHLADKDLEEFVTELCTSHIESDFHLGSSFLQMFAVEGKDGQECLAIGLSHALYDGVSLPKLLRDLETLYAGNKVTGASPFSAYMAQTREASLRSKAAAYWRTLLSGSSLSTINTPSPTPQRGVFKSVPVPISPPPRDTTTANLLTAAWALVLARRLQSHDVTFAGITSGRTLDMVGAEDVVGPTYQFTPIRVAFEAGWTARDLLAFVQRQSAESLEHDFLGFEAIAKEVGGWAGFFGSVVNHQDFEDFDEMPFGGGSCRVEIANPHGDSPWPVKAVTFVDKEGRVNVGVVGEEEGFVDEVMAELAGVVGELAGEGGDVLVIGERR